MRNIKNEEAVSPVIGTILMVVITVIIAAVLAVFAFGVGEPGKQAPSAALKITSAAATGDTVEVVHGGGDAILITNLLATVDNDDTVAGGDLAGIITVNDIMGGAPNNYFDPGETATITGGSLVAGNIARVRIIDSESGKPVLDATARTLP